jgi:hypothetical protein
MLRGGFVIWLIAAGVFVLLSQAHAQIYPSRPIRVIISVSAGGTGDIITRAIGEQLSKRLGQPFVLEPRPGGNQTIAGRACAEAAPDGYTVCVLSGETLSSNEFVLKKVPYDPEKDFAPITLLFLNPQALVVNASLGVKTLDELIAYARSHPGTLSYLAPSLSHYLFFEYLNQKHGTDFVRIPFRGGGEAVGAMLSGAVPVSFFGLANFPHLPGSRHHEWTGHRQLGTLEAVSPNADHCGGRIQGADPAAVFRDDGPRQDAAKGDRPVAAGNRGDRRRADVPPKAVYRSLAGADRQYARGIRTILER